MAYRRHWLAQGLRHVYEKLLFALPTGLLKAPPGKWASLHWECLVIRSQLLLQLPSALWAKVSVFLLEQALTQKDFLSHIAILNEEDIHTLYCVL